MPNQPNGEAVRNHSTLVAGSDGTNGVPVLVDSTGRLVVGAGTAATSLGKAEDAPHTSGDVGVQALAVRNSNHAALTNTDLDYSPIAVNSKGDIVISGAGVGAVSTVTTTSQQIGGLDGNTYPMQVMQAPWSYLKCTADAQVKGSAGVLHTVTVSCNDAAPTAGSVIIYDSLTETGTEIFNHTFTTTPFVPFSLTFDAAFATGLYVGFTTTADVNVTVTYR